jgi:hypothetical protein
MGASQVLNINFIVSLNKLLLTLALSTSSNIMGHLCGKSLLESNFFIFLQGIISILYSLDAELQNGVLELF